MAARALGVVAALCAHIAKAAAYLGDLRRGAATVLVPPSYSSFSGGDLGLGRAVHARDVFECEGLFRGRHIVLWAESRCRTAISSFISKLKLERRRVLVADLPDCF